MIDEKMISDLIIKIRQQTENPSEVFSALDSLLTGDTDAFCKALDTRWLVAVCDTYADYGTPLERSNAMIISTFVNTIKFMWTAEKMCLECPENLSNSQIQKLKEKNQILYDGVRTLGFSLDRGNASYNLFRRINNVLCETPSLQEIFHIIILRIQTETMHPLVRLHNEHGNFFKHSLNYNYCSTPTDRYKA